MVRLHHLTGRVVLEVEDDGVGFRAPERQGMGLVSMRERAELVNGRLEVRNGSQGGALVRFVAPTGSTLV